MVDSRPISSGQRPDLELFQKVIVEVRPRILIELGTGPAQLSFPLAEIAASIGATLWTFDSLSNVKQYPPDGEVLREIYPKLLALPNVKFFKEDILELNQRIIAVLGDGRCTFLFCDNGHKERELVNYARFMQVGAVIGCHDYKSEVKPHFIEPFMRGSGFSPLYHEDAAVLDLVAEYGTSRFWKRTEVIE